MENRSAEGCGCILRLLPYLLDNLFQFDFDGRQAGGDAVVHFLGNRLAVAFKGFDTLARQLPQMPMGFFKLVFHPLAQGDVLGNGRH